MSSQSALASPASSISEFSIVSHPQSPWNAAVLVEAGSDDDEIVFSPRSPTENRPDHARTPGGYDSEDDFILIPSPRAAMPAVLVGLALTIVPAPSHIPNDEQLVTPTMPHNNPPALPTPSSSGTPNHSQTGVATNLASPTLCQIIPGSLSPVKHRRNRLKAKRAAHASPLNASAASYPSPAPSPTHATGLKTAIAATPARDQRCTAAQGSIAPQHKTQPALERVARLEQLAAECEGIGARGVVVEDDDENTLYQAAVNYISSFLANPAQAGTPRLPLLQALVVELGVCSPTSPLPTSVKAARTLLRTQAHINVRDYIAARGKGLDALKKVMFPSRSQLLKDLRKRRVPVKWIKEHGLSMFLVQF